MADGGCDCGHHGRTISGFSGRSACAFRLPGGASVDAWRLAVVLKHQPLRSFRLTQRGLSDFLLELIATAPSVIYKVTTTDGEVNDVENPAKLPPVSAIEMVEEDRVGVRGGHD